MDNLGPDIFGRQEGVQNTPSTQDMVHGMFSSSDNVYRFTNFEQLCM